MKIFDIGSFTKKFLQMSSVRQTINVHKLE